MNKFKIKINNGIKANQPSEENIPNHKFLKEEN